MSRLTQYLRSRSHKNEPSSAPEEDVSIFTIETAMTTNDKQSFLRLLSLTKLAFKNYTYLEIGSDLGASLLPSLADDKCSLAVSVDPRPVLQNDERGVQFPYAADNEARMLKLLGERLPNTFTSRLQIIRNDISKTKVEELRSRPNFGFIDGEHTNTACFSDAAHLRRMMTRDCIIAFHDADLIGDAIVNFELHLRMEGIPLETVFLPDTVAAIGLNRMAAIVRKSLSVHALDRDGFLSRSKDKLYDIIANNRHTRTDQSLASS